jgi:transcription initiation factor TFIID subunit TAF12
MCLLEDRRARHLKANAEHSSGTASPAAGVRLVRIDRAEPLFQKPPIDRPRQLRQGMAHIRGLVEPRPEKIVLSPQSRRSFGRIESSPARLPKAENLNQSRRSICRKMDPSAPLSRVINTCSPSEPS